MSEPEDEDDLTTDAIDFVRSAHAFIAWHEASGSVGFPRSETRTKPAAAHMASVGQPEVDPSHNLRSAQPAQPKPAETQPKLAETQPKLAEPLPNFAPEERVRRLELVNQRVQSCVACGLHKARDRTVFSRGSPTADLCFVGEGPGEEEDRQGSPFVGKAGQLLDKMIAAMGLHRDDVYVCNVVKCRPPDNRTPEPSEMATCLPFLNEQLDIVRPKAIVALGGTALKGLMGPSEGITKARGSWRLYRGQTPLMPTFHPAYVLRQPTREVKAQVWSDLQQVLQRLGRQVPVRGTD